MARRLATVLDAEKPDVVSLHNLSGFSASVIGLLAERKVPVVATLHDYYFACVNTAMFRRGENCAGRCLHCRVLTAMRKRASRLVTSVVGITHAVLEQVRAVGAFKGVPAFINPNTNPQRVASTFRPDHRPGQPLRIGFLGRLSETKGIETIIEAMGLLRDIPVSALIAGRGSDTYDASLRGSARGLRVEFAGHIAPGVFFPKIDVLVVPSKWREPLGRVLFEAWSYGVPVIGADSGGIPETIRQTNAGIIFPPGNAAELAMIVRGLVEQGFEAARWQRACTEATNQFNFDHHVDKLVGIYQDAVENGRSRSERGPRLPAYLPAPIALPPAAGG